MELTILGIAAAPIIVALIQLIKTAGMPDRYAPWLNAALSTIAYGVIVLLQNGALDATLVTYTLNVLIIFLTAAGVYDRAQALLTQPAVK